MRAFVCLSVCLCVCMSPWFSLARSGVRFRPFALAFSRWPTWLAGWRRAVPVRERECM